MKVIDRAKAVTEYFLKNLLKIKINKKQNKKTKI